MFKGFVTYFTDFLKYISAPENHAPLDFYSWHLYTDNIEEMVTHAGYVEKTLVEYGFSETENILNEWNRMDEKWSVLGDSTMTAASFVAGVFCALQTSPVDLGTYYDAQPAMPYCGIFDFRGPRKPFYAFKAFNTLYALGREAPTVSEVEGVYACAASSGTEGAILLSNYGDHPREVTVEVSGFASDKGIQIEHYYLDESRNLELTRTETCREQVPVSAVALPSHTVVLLKLSRRRQCGAS